MDVNFLFEQEMSECDARSEQTDAVVPFLRRSKRWTGGKGKKNSAWILRISSSVVTRYTQDGRRYYKFVVGRVMLTCATRISRAQPDSARIPPGLMSHCWQQCNNDNIWNSTRIFSWAKRIVPSRKCGSVGGQLEPAFVFVFIFIFRKTKKIFFITDDNLWVCSNSVGGATVPVNS